MDINHLACQVDSKNQLPTTLTFNPVVEDDGSTRTVHTPSPVSPQRQAKSGCLHKTFKILSYICVSPQRSIPIWISWPMACEHMADSSHKIKTVPSDTEVTSSFRVPQRGQMKTCRDPTSPSLFELCPTFFSHSSLSSCSMGQSESKQLSALKIDADLFSPFSQTSKRPRFYSTVAFKPHSHLFLSFVSPKLAFPDAFRRLSLHLVTLCLVPASSYSRFPAIFSFT